MKHLTPHEIEQSRASVKAQLLYLASISEWLRVAPKRPPMRLSNYLRKLGGIQDQMGEVTNLTGGKRYRGFGLVSSHGLTLDEAAYWAWQEGYVVTPERPTIAEFLEALDDDLSGFPVYSGNDFDRLQEYEAAEKARHELDALGILADSVSKQRLVEKALYAAAEAL